MSKLRSHNQQNRTNGRGRANDPIFADRAGKIPAGAIPFPKPVDCSDGIDDDARSIEAQAPACVAPEDFRGRDEDSAPIVGPPDSGDRRRRMIAEAAYYRAERRSFEPGADEQDWLEAEREIDAESARADRLPAAVNQPEEGR